MKESFFVGLCNKIDNVSDWLGKIFSWLIVLLTLLVVFEVVTRSMNAPTTWSFELRNYVFGAYFMLVASYALLYGSHVRIDIITSRLSKMTESIISLISYIFLFFPFISVWLYFGWSYFSTSWSISERSWSAWGPPIWPVKLVIPLAALFLILQGISELIKTIVMIRILSITAKEVSR